MPRYCFIAILWVTSITQAPAQDRGVIVDSAAGAFSRGDTATTIQYLESYAVKYPETLLVLFVNLRLAGFYRQAKSYDSALAKLTYALKLKPKDNELGQITMPGLTLLRYAKLPTIKMDICVSLSDLFREAGNTEEALKYLDLADKDYMYGSCVNGMIMYKTYLSLRYADLYLSKGDTARAINRLLEFIVWEEPYSTEATVKLRALLLKKYSPAQISQEIKRGIAGLKINHKQGKDGTAKQNIRFSLFGYAYQWLPCSNKKDHKKYLQENRNLQLLSKL